MRSPWRRVRESIGVWPIVWLLIVLGIVGYGVRQLVDSRQFLATAEAADGVVVGTYRVESSHYTGGEHGSWETSVDYLPVVRFATADNQVVQFRSGTGAAAGVGGSVRVLYDPANPRHARLDTWVARWGSAAGLVLVGLFMVASTVVVDFWRGPLRVRGAYSRYDW